MTARIRFRTNLDEAQPYLAQLSNYEGEPPPVGARIEFESFHRKASFQLEVVALTYVAKNSAWDVELHIPKTFAGQSIREWMDWFARHVRGEVSP
jgi:hypothetical protein